MDEEATQDTRSDAAVYLCKTEAVWDLTFQLSEIVSRYLTTCLLQPPTTPDLSYFHFLKLSFFLN